MTLELTNPPFPTPESLAAITDGDFGFAVLGVLTALANADGYLLENEFRVYTEAAAELLSVRWRDPAVQYRAFALLSAPPALEQALDKIEQIVRQEHVAVSARETAGDTVLRILEGTPQTAGARGELATRVLDALRDKRPDHLSRAVELGRGDAPAAAGGGFQRLLGRGRQAGSGWLTARNAKVNACAREICTRVGWLAEELDDQALRRAVSDIEVLLDDQPYRIVLVGEMKHGKSSLFNAIAGGTYSPVGESDATTAAVVELSYSQEVRFGGTWFSREAADEMLQFARDNSEGNPFTTRWAETFASILHTRWYEAARDIPRVTTIAELRDYLAADGEFARAVRKVTLGLPVDALRSGAVLSDTPGLNDPIRPREDIALEEAQTADCICFVLNAEKLGTESERRFLSNLARRGRAVHLLPVLTRIDRLGSDDRRGDAARTAQTFVEECLKDSAVHVLDVLSINASGAAAESARVDGRPPAPDSDLARLREALGKAVSDPLRQERYEQRVERSVDDLQVHLAAAAERWAAAHEARIPSSVQLKEQASLAGVLKSLAEDYRDHITRQLGSVRERLLSDHEAYQERIEGLKAELLATVRAELDAEIQRTSLRDDEAWGRFDDRIHRRVLEPAIHRFEREQTSRFDQWNTELGVFRTEVHADTKRALDRLNVEVERLEGLTATQSQGLGVLLDAKELVERVNRQIGAAALGAGGATVALGGTMAFLASVTTLAASLAAAAPVAAVVGAAAVAGWAVVSVMNKEKARARLIQLKVDGARKKLDEVFQDKPSKHAEGLEKLWRDFANGALVHYAPVIGTALAVSGRSEAKRALWERARTDGRRMAEELKSGRLLAQAG